MRCISERWIEDIDPETGNECKYGISYVEITKDHVIFDFEKSGPDGKSSVSDVLRMMGTWEDIDELIKKPGKYFYWHENVKNNLKPYALFCRICNNGELQYSLARYAPTVGCTFNKVVDVCSSKEAVSRGLPSDDTSDSPIYQIFMWAGKYKPLTEERIFEVINAYKEENKYEEK